MLASQGDNDKCQEPRVPFIPLWSSFRWYKAPFCFVEKKWEEGNEAWQAYWKESSFLWTDRHTKCQGKKLSKGPTKRAPVATLLYYIYKLCRCTHSAGRKQGKWKTWYYCTMEPQLSKGHWSMEKTSNKTQHHDCHGTTEFISSVSAILINIHPPTTPAEDKNLDWAFSLYTNCSAEHSYPALGILRPPINCHFKRPFNWVVVTNCCN